MKLFVELSCVCTVGVREMKGAVELRSWDPRKGMQSNIVESAEYAVQYGLLQDLVTQRGS